jgi:hypothetical protein
MSEIAHEGERQMAKSETLWRCSTCDKLHGSESDALKCEEKHALFVLVQSISDNPTFFDVSVDGNNDIIREDIDDETYHTDAVKPESLDDVNTVIITTFSTVVRRDIYQRLGTEYKPTVQVYEFKEE